MKIPVLLILVGIVSAAVHQMQLRRVQHHRTKNLLELSKTTQHVNDFGDVTYVANITIGTPGQNFSVCLDTGSGLLWVPDASCGQKYCDTVCMTDFCNLVCEAPCCEGENTYTDPKSACYGKRQYKSGRSSTYKKIGSEWAIQYGTGSADGVLAQDTVAFGDSGLVVPNTFFGQAKQNDAFFKGKPFDGILGLSMEVDPEIGGSTPLVQAISKGLLDEPVFTVYLEGHGNVKNVEGGVFTWGGIDTQNCDSKIDYMPLTSKTKWQFRMDGLSIGNYTNSQGWDVKSDTGASNIFGPKAEVDKLAKSLKALFTGKDYFLPCTGQPDLVLTIGGNKYTIKPENYLVDTGANMYRGVKYCFLAITGRPEMTSWVLGHPFIRQFCQIYDIGSKRIGFAKAHTNH